MARCANLLLLACAAWCGLYELQALGVGGLPVGDVKVLHLVVMGTGSALCVARGVLHRDERTAWLLIGGAFASWIAGEVYFTAVLWDDASPPVPSCADAGYLGLPPLLLAGLLSLLRSRMRSLPRTLWVDGVTAALAVSAVSAAVVVQAVLAGSEGTTLSVATNVAYPVADLLLLGVVAGALAASGWKANRALCLVIGGVLAFWLADSIYLLRVAQGTWVSGGPVEVGWWGAALLFAAAAWGPRAPGRTRRLTGPVVIAMPTAFATLALGVLVWGSLGALNPIAVALSTASLAAVMVRLVITFQQHGRTLSALRHQADHDALTGLAEPHPLRGPPARGARRRRRGPAARGRRALRPRRVQAHQRLARPRRRRRAPGPRRPAAATRVRRGLVARLGGDEFAVALAQPGDAATVRRAAEAALAAVAAPVGVGGHHVRPRASAGIALAEPGTVDADDLLRDADIAMYAAKGQGKDRTEVFAGHMREAVLERMRMKAELERALAGDELRRGLPAHRRPRHGPDRGRRGPRALAAPASAACSAPGDFIPVAEETRLISGVGALRAARRVRGRRRAGAPRCRPAPTCT